MRKFLSSMFFLCVPLLSFELEAGDFRTRLQSLCNQIEKIGLSWVNLIVYCDCSDECPAVDMSFIKDDCPSVFAANWRTNLDSAKVPQVQAVLAVAQLSSACCNFLGSSNGTNLGSAGASDVALVPQGHSYRDIMPKWSAYVPPTAAMDLKRIEQNPPEKIYFVDDLSFERSGPYGNKDNSIFRTKDGRRLFVKNRHLKNNYDSLLVSYFTSSLGEKLCPGQIVKIVPVIDKGELKIGSFEVENYIGLGGQLGLKQKLLSLVLDLMRIYDRGRGNVGYSYSTNLAVAVDVDLGGFEEGGVIDQHRTWITKLTENYGALDDEFKQALDEMTAFTDADLLTILDAAEDELKNILPPEHHSILSTRHGIEGNILVLGVKIKALDTLRQMHWVFKNFDQVKALVDASRKKDCIASLLNLDNLPVDEHGFFLHEAIVREDAQAIDKVCASRGRSFFNMLIYGSVKSRNRQVLEAIKRCCLSNPEWGSIANNCDITLKSIGPRRW